MRPAALLLVLCVLGCPKQPVFETVRALGEPGDAACTTACEGERDGCLSSVASLQAMCESGARAAQAQCMAGRGAGPLQSPFSAAGAACLRRPCPSEEPRCKAGFESCWEGCGGTLTLEQRCVLNCPD